MRVKALGESDELAFGHAVAKHTPQIRRNDAPSERQEMIDRLAKERRFAQRDIDKLAIASGFQPRPRVISLPWLQRRAAAIGFAAAIE